MQVYILLKVGSSSALSGFCEVQGSPWAIDAPLPGAQEIISTITSRPTVTKLILSHNTLQDDGCIVLFKFLGSDVGNTKRISEIKLAKNGIGDRGLLAISEFLKGNTVLKELYLPQNEFQNAPSVISTFISALNTSHLEKLNHCGFNTAFRTRYCVVYIVTTMSLAQSLAKRERSRLAGRNRYR